MAAVTQIPRSRKTGHSENQKNSEQVVRKPCWPTLITRLQRHFVGDDGSPLRAGGNFFDAGGEGAVFGLEFLEEGGEVARVIEGNFVERFPGPRLDDPNVVGRGIQPATDCVVDADGHHGPNGQTLRNGDAGGEMNRCSLRSRWGACWWGISQLGRLGLRLLTL
jgi:hypothetical protein